MAAPVAMPKLGMTMREGRVVAWPVAVGARVEKGDTVVVIESEKAEVEVEAPAAGVLRHVYVEPDTTVPCGTLLAALTESGDEAFDADEFRRLHDRPEAVPAEAAAPPTGAGAAPTERRREGVVTPAARALARKLGVDPSAVAGSGPGGRITREDLERWAEKRKDLVEVAPGVSLEAPTLGEGEPVLLLPGFGVDVAAFARQTPVLAERFRVLGVNPRGVGLSEAPAQDRYDVAQAAADAAALVDRPAHVVGASLGAAVAVELALAHADRVRSLTLITPFVDAGPRLLAVVDAWCRLARETSAETLARALLPWLFSPRFLADESQRERTVRGLASIVTRIPPETLERSAAGLRAWSGTRRDDLARIRVSALVLSGGDDLLTPGGANLAERIAGATRLVLPECGHALALEEPERVNEAVLEHLAAVV